MYLYSYEIGRTVGQKVATLNFLDGSFILDKIFVGLANRHYQAPEPEPAEFEVPMICLSCDGKTIKEIAPKKVSRKVVTNYKKVSVGPTGGSIIVGQEQFTENECDIPDVSYNFTLLVEAISQANIKIETLKDINPKYYQNYTGTLREVLSNWCADFGFTFYWGNNSVIGIDLKSDIDYISKIKSAALDPDLPVESFTENQSLEGTVDQKFVSRYLKPFRVKSYNENYIYDRNFEAIKPEDFDIDGTNITRAVLGKYHQNLRTIYCMKDFKKFGKYIGFTSITSPSKNLADTFKKIYDYGYNNPAITKFIEKCQGAVIDVAIYDPRLAEKYIDWENAIADMIGKYYKGGEEPIDIQQQCSEYLYYKKDVSVTPVSQIYTQDNKYDLPFYNVLTGPGVEGSYNYKDFKKLYIFSRDPVYGITQEEYDKTMLKQDGEDAFVAYLPQVLPIEGVAYSRLIGAKADAERSNDSQTVKDLEEIIKTIDQLKATEGSERRAVFVFRPPQKILSQLLTVEWKNKNNQKEKVKKEDDDKNKEGNGIKECKLACERNIVEEGCGGDCIKPKNPPYVGLKSRNARTLMVDSNLLGRSVQIICPVEENYYGYETANPNQRFTIKGAKLVFGEIENISKNTLSLQVLESDMTSDFEQMDGSSKVLDMLVPDGTGKFTKTTPAQYHSDLAKKLTNSILSERKNINVSIIGLDFRGLNQYVNPSKGLISLNINLNENGATAQLGFSNRPKVLPKREAISQRIGPLLRFNSLRQKSSFERKQFVQIAE